jgi:hypothetical protein
MYEYMGTFHMRSVVLTAAKHNCCWVMIHSQGYDVASFLNSHPGGANVVLRYGGRDATTEEDPIHPPGMLEGTLSASQILGPSTHPLWFQLYARGPGEEREHPRADLGGRGIAGPARRGATSAAHSSPAHPPLAHVGRPPLAPRVHTSARRPEGDPDARTRWA